MLCNIAMSSRWWVVVCTYFCITCKISQPRYEADLIAVGEASTGNQTPSDPPPVAQVNNEFPSYPKEDVSDLLQQEEDFINGLVDLYKDNSSPLKRNMGKLLKEIRPFPLERVGYLYINPSNQSNGSIKPPEVNDLNKWIQAYKGKMVYVDKQPVDFSTSYRAKLVIAYIPTIPKPQVISDLTRTPSITLQNGVGSSHFKEVIYTLSAFLVVIPIRNNKLFSVTFIKGGGQWYYYNTSDQPVLITDKAAIEASKQASLFLYDTIY